MIKIVEVAKTAIASKASVAKVSRLGLKARKYAPDILVAAGVIGVVAATVMACRATAKAQPIIDQVKQDVTDIKGLHGDEKSIEYAKDLTGVYFKASKDL